MSPLQLILDAFESRTGLRAWKVLDEDMATLVCDGRLLLILKLQRRTGWIRLATSLGRPGGGDTEEATTRLLDAPFDGAGNQGEFQLTFRQHPWSGRVFALSRMHASQLDATRFPLWIEAFMDQVSPWGCDAPEPAPRPVHRRLLKA
ncbi:MULTISPECIES: type III secretion system chaperone [unclassified Rhizobacter]|uniref:type III secretion system chaperone n=1 Tax=unclassified Rhizobacter TaxID=2640088 RepID=UPI0012F7E699|nr:MULTISPECIES: type III secretion system chaperone [unclassified Rhizobacter]